MGLSDPENKKNGSGHARSSEKKRAEIRFSDPALKVSEKGDKGKDECILATLFMKSHTYSYILDASVGLQAPVRVSNVGNGKLFTAVKSSTGLLMDTEFEPGTVRNKKRGNQMG